MDQYQKAFCRWARRGRLSAVEQRPPSTLHKSFKQRGAIPSYHGMLTNNSEPCLSEVASLAVAYVYCLFALHCSGPTKAYVRTHGPSVPHVQVMQKEVFTATQSPGI